MKKKIALYGSLVAIAFVAIVCTHEEEMPVSDSHARLTANTTTPFHTKVGEPIALETANKWIGNYLEKHAGEKDLIHAHYFGKETFERLLRQPGAVGISLHYAINDAGVPQLLLVAVDEKGMKMTGPEQEGYQDISYLCPQLCAEDKLEEQ